MFNKQEVYDLIKSKNIWFKVDEHEAVYTMDELTNIKLSYPSQDAKNLFVRDDKKRNYYLITVKGDKRVDLKKFRQDQNTRPLSFASSDDLLAILGLIPGSVTPLGLLNDEEKKVIFYLDDEFTSDNQIIGVHPNDNTATLWLHANDLIDIIKEHGNQVYTFKIGE